MQKFMTKLWLSNDIFVPDENVSKIFMPHQDFITFLVLPLDLLRPGMNKRNADVEDFADFQKAVDNLNYKVLLKN